MAVMATPRTHCRCTRQARSQRVPEFCDDQTPPSCLIANSVVEPRCPSVCTLALPSLTREGLVTFLVCALHLLFVRSCDFAHHGLYCSHVWAHAHQSSLQHLPFSVFAFVVFQCPHGENQHMRLPHGSTGVESLLLHMYSALRTTLSPTATIWCVLPALCADMGLHMGVTWCSDSKLCVLPKGYTQCHESTGSDEPHSHCHT